MKEYDTIKKIEDKEGYEDDVFEVTKNIVQTQTITLSQLFQEKSMYENEITHLTERINEIDKKIAEITAVKDSLVAIK